jgi:hypothetical protein
MRNGVLPRIPFTPTGRERTWTRAHKDDLVISVDTGALDPNDVLTVYGVSREDFHAWRMDYLKRKAADK